MIRRRIAPELESLLQQAPAVVLTGPRQVGKTTLALEIAAGRDATYLDLESEADRSRLAEPELYFADHVEELTGRRPSQEAMIAAMGVEAEYLHKAFEAMKARHGSIDGYLEQVLGVDARRRAAIEDHILA